MVGILYILVITSLLQSCTADCIITGNSNILTDGRSCTGDVIIPNNVNVIGPSAFYECTGITSVTIPSSVTNIGKNAFFGCTGLKTLSFDSGSQLTDIAYGTFSGCTGLKAIVIPSSVRFIGPSAFSGCTSLINITIPSTITTVVTYTFKKCTSLRSVTIPSSVKSIQPEAFQGCTYLQSVYILSTDVTIDIFSFSGCTNLSLISTKQVNDMTLPSVGNNLVVSFDGRYAIQRIDSVNSGDKVESSIVIDSQQLNITKNLCYHLFMNTSNTIVDISQLKNDVVITTENKFTVKLNDRINSCYHGMYHSVNTSLDCWSTDSICGGGKYYKITEGECDVCISGCLICDNPSTCSSCEYGYRLIENGSCLHLEHCQESYGGVCRICEFGYFLTEYGTCKLTDIEGCLIEEEGKCTLCNTTMVITEGGGCSTQDGMTLSNGQNVSLGCGSKYYNENRICKKCTVKYGENCDECDINTCLSCFDEYIFNTTGDGICKIIYNCKEDEAQDSNGLCTEKVDNCIQYMNGRCIECIGVLDEINNTCVDSNTSTTHCDDALSTGCKKCSFGFFYDKSQARCEQCKNNCATCFNESICLSCSDNSSLVSHECISYDDNSTRNCSQFIPGGSSVCAICNDGYFRDDNGQCSTCIDNCSECRDSVSCTTCNNDFFLLTSNNTCRPFSKLGDVCIVKTQRGCEECVEGYFINGQYCTSCNEEVSQCTSCDRNGHTCTSCTDDYVLVNSQSCVHYSSVSHCKKGREGKCTSCTLWHRPSSDGTYCESHVEWWVILISVIVVVIVFIAACTVVYIVTMKTLRHMSKKRQEEENPFALFSMSRSNIEFIKTSNPNIVVSTNSITFSGEEDEEIGVNVETKGLICVGNKSGHTQKVQISMKEGSIKYTLRTNPTLVVIPCGKAVEYEVFITPLCTCTLHDTIKVFNIDMKTSEEGDVDINIVGKTQISTRLDPDELVEEKKIGEGSFGVVYKGMFRGNVVAIKNMKETSSSGNNGGNKEDSMMIEFEQEVSMLDKFRSEYIVHFYGAVFIPTKVCMVTEYAQYGSLNDLIDRRVNDPINMKMRVKILVDAARGISYLHSNGILHRDIKPDNILVVSLDINDKVHGKLTDFGSSRNINMMMTNMTFTKGIGTPVYMAPEVLKKEKYKKSADIYSFSITMYEVFKWGEAYPKSDFKFSWKIAEFITSGKRLPQHERMTPSVYSLISSCWSQSPSDRPNIESVVNTLSVLLE